MADLVETVARAIAEYGTSHFGDDSPFDEQSQLQRAMRLGEARAALSAIEAAGYRVVPVEPTEAMIEASWQTTIRATPDERMAVILADSKRAGHRLKMRQRYRAMLASAPKVTP